VYNKVQHNAHGHSHPANINGQLDEASLQLQVRKNEKI
jgi:hypothetical protein